MVKTPPGVEQKGKRDSRKQVVRRLRKSRSMLWQREARGGGSGFRCGCREKSFLVIPKKLFKNILVKTKNKSNKKPNENVRFN
ncbi:hypothetical protein [Succinatimonas hippei]|uniref:hypothetical protein n=1 Tax=Succinatimonas hippei TaxID=626938 RepID=UPI00255C8676|nr:hypothetical protein [Succinatimonas hippei]